MSFTKLDSGIVMSTVWQEPDHVLRVWITLLVLADARGRVKGSVPGLAHTATKSIPETEDALGRLMAPDPYSRTRDHEGRRIEEVEGGWRILNYTKYRESRDPEARKEWDRERKRSVRSTQRSENVRHCPPVSASVHTNSAKAEAEAEAEEDLNQSVRPARAEISDAESDLTNRLNRVEHCEAVTYLLDSLPEKCNRAAWCRTLAGYLQGMGPRAGKALTPEELAAACSEYVASPDATWQPRHFLGFANGVLSRRNKPDTMPRSRGTSPPDPLNAFKIAYDRAVAEEAEDPETHRPEEAA